MLLFILSPAAERKPALKNAFRARGNPLQCPSMAQSNNSPALSVSVVIPVLNAARYLPALFEAFATQEGVQPREIILVDSMSTDDTVKIAQAHPLARVVPIHNFTHGRSRNLGAREATGDVIVVLSQDARPQDSRWLSRLVAPFEDPRVAATYSRQVPRDDANPMETFFLQHRFPPGEPVRRERTGPGELTLEQVFFSNVSAAIRRSVLLQFPFDEELIMSEDQQFSRDLLNAGYAVVYCPESIVVHSHNYSLRVCVRRYFDSVYSLTKIFPAHGFATSSAMGLSYLRHEMTFMATHHPFWLPYYLLYNLAKIAGTLLAHVGDRLPLWMLRRVSLHSYHWERR